jgi:hypothetical protein
MSRWVRRGEDGKIEGAAEEHLAGFDEELQDNDAELRAFMDNTLPSDPTGLDSGKALIERRARALERKGDKLGAVVLRTGG